MGSLLKVRLAKVLVMLLVLFMILPGLPLYSGVFAASTPDTGPAAKLIFTFEDGWKDQFTNALPILNAAGFKATAYISNNSVLGSNSEFMKLDDLKTLYADGWDISNHTTNHDSTTATDAATLERLTNEYLDNQNWIIENVGSRGAYHASYPDGSFAEEYISILRSIGTLTARTLVQANQATPISDPDDYYKLPIKSVSSVSPGSLDRTTTAITQAVADGSTVVLMIQRVEPDLGDWVLTTTDLQMIVDYVKQYTDQGTLEVMTMSEWYDLQVSENPIGPITPPAPIVTNDDSTNLVAGLTTPMEYKLDNAGYVPYISSIFDTIDLSGDHTLSVRYAASGINPPGPATILTFTAALDPPPTTARIIFTFDDGWKSQVTNALPIMNAAGFRATAYVNLDSIVGSNPVEMRTSDLKILYANGWDIANHTTNHDSTTLTDPATINRLRSEYLDNQNWLIQSIGARGAYHACYPSGSVMPEYIEMLKAIGVLTARTTVEANQVTPITNPDDYYKLPIKSVSSNPGSIDRTKAAIDKAVSDGTTVILMIHKVEPVVGSLVTTTADFQSIVNYVRNFVHKHQIQVVTMSEWYYWMTGTNQPVPETPPAPAVYADDIDNVVSGMAPGMEYSLDGANYTHYIAGTFNALDLSGDHILNVRFAACGINPAGPATTLTFAANTVTPPLAAAKLLFTFDGGWKGQITYALPILNAAGFKATSYVMRDFVLNESATDPDLLNLNDVLALAASGWDIGNHTTNHDDQGNLTDEDTLARLRTEYLENQSWIASAIGSQGAYHAAYPSGQYSQPLIEILKEIGTLTARSTREENQAIPITSRNDYYKLPCAPLSSDPMYDDVQSVKDAIDEAINDGSTVIVFMNQVLPDYEDGNVTVADLQTIVDYVKSYADLGEISVMTISDWYYWQIAHYPVTPVTPPAPSITGDDEANTISGMTNLMEYRLNDDLIYTPYDPASFASVNLSGDLAIHVRYAAAGINPAGPETTLTFTTNRYLVIFDKNGVESDPDPMVIIADVNSKIVAPAAPTRTGYTFAGWFKEATCINAWNFSTDVVTTNITLYAKWTINSYTVTFNSQGGTAVTSKTTNYNTKISSPTSPTRTGYAFAGWYKEAACINVWSFSTDVVTNNTTLYAKWTINSYTVAFNSQGGTAVTSKTANFSAKITAPAAPARTGYTFAGWYKEAGCVNAWNFSTDMVTTNITLFAKWTINSYTVTFNSQGGTAVASRTAVYNTLITAPAAPTCVGYLFVGWYTSLGYTTPWDFATNKILGPTTIYARWLKSSIAVLAAQSTSYSSIQLSWTATTGANYYEIYRATSSAGTYTLIQTQVIPAATFANAGLTTGKTYYYKVRAYAVIGATKIYSGYSAVASVKPVPATPASLKAVSAGYSSIKLTWAAVAGASGYAIYRATSLTGTYSYVVSTTALSYTNSGRTAGRTYYYKIKAYRIVGTTRVYGNLTAVVSAKPIPATAATFTVARYSSTSVKVSWSAVSGASGYEIYRATTLTGTYSLLKRTTLRYYTNTGLTTGSTYFYKVRAYRYVGSTRIYGDFTSVKSAAP